MTIVERVLLAVELIPSGSVVSYGDIAELTGTGPRQVGAVLRDHGHETAWWRVTNAAGELPIQLLADAGAHWDAERIERKRNGRGCVLQRPDMHQLADAYVRELASG